LSPRDCCAALVAVLAFGEARAACPTTEGCPVAPQTGIQPCPKQAARILERGSRGRLSSSGPLLGPIDQGCTTSQKVAATAPCVLVKAIGHTESLWGQFCATACDKPGKTVISFDCGYGIMQVTSGMRGGAGFEPLRVAKEPTYNVGAGMKILHDKWRATPCVGDRQPKVLEDWYLATWAYNGYGFVNNPNNPNYPAARPIYNGPGSLSRGKYPYQEVVWGFIRNPPGSPRKWDAVLVSYPNNAEICNTSGCRQSGKLSAPTPTHLDACQTAAARDDAELIAESPPGTLVVKPGERVKKTFTLRNTGDTIWSKANGYRLALTSLDPLGGPPVIELAEGVSYFGEDDAALAVSLKPGSSGPHRATYKLASGATPFGPELVFAVNVSTPTDADGDGHGRTGAGGDDCDDEDPHSYPGAVELCDGRDNDCNGSRDDGVSRGCSTPCGMGKEVCFNGEFKGCSALSPRAETCDGTDEDCNERVDDGELCGEGKACVNGACAPVPVEPPPGAPPPQSCGCSGASAPGSSMIVAIGLFLIVIARRGFSSSGGGRRGSVKSVDERPLSRREIQWRDEKIPTSGGKDPDKPE
jgi:hypothetical protein